MKPNNPYKIKNLLIMFSMVKIAIWYLVSFFNFFISFLFNKKSIVNCKLKNYKSFLLLPFIIYNLTFNISIAQTYPVQINTQLVPPYSGYLPDYADPNAQNLKVFLQFNDFTTPQYNLKLKFEIKGNGFSLVTKAIYNPPPISLQPGQPILLSGADLAPYLTSNNLDFIGINQSQYEQRMALPEGYYSICITAYDYYSGTPVQVSNEACAQGWFILSNPPLLNLPLCNAVVTPLQPQNIFFNWTPVNLGSPNSSFNTSYLFELWEMRPDSTVNPNQLVQNTQPVFNQVTTFNSLNYGITETPLLLYTKYAWRVKVIDGSGKDWFINNGYSQVCTFYYGSIANTLGDAVNLNLQAQAVDYVSGLATWTLQNFYNSYQLDVREVNTQDWISYTTTINNQALTNLAPGKTYECRVKGFGNAINGNFSNLANFTTPVPPTINLQAEALDYTNGRAFWALQNSYTTYQLEVRKKNTANWFPYTTIANSQVIDNLEPNKTYQCRVKGFGTNFNSDYGNIAEFTTPAPPSYNCNQAAPIYSNNATPLPYNKAITGMTVKSGQFDVKIKFINPGTMGAGYYTGNGYAMMFGVLPIPVTFTNVFIDANQRQQQGIIHAITKGMKNWMQQFDIEDAEEIATYVDGTLDSVYINNGQYCYITEQNPTPVCTPIDTTKLPLVIRDGEGNQYVVNAGPPPTVTGPTSYLNISTDNLAATSTLMVQFAKAPNQNFGFDSKEYPAFTEEYECIKFNNGKNYFVANKSIGNGINQNDRVIATYTINNFNAAQLSFKTKGGATLTKTNPSNNSYEVTNIPPNTDCIYAWYNNQKIGKLNIISLNKISKKVILVPVNGASTMGITQQDLNDIYKQANASFTVSTAPNFTFNLGNDGLEEADAKLMSKYSAEMRALRDAYKKKDSLYDKNAYYIFVVPNFSNPLLQGYMVRGRAVGFIKTGATINDIAHELGHGAFKLEHTFDAITKGTSNNLLDYSNNTHLTKSQWLNIQNPTNELTWFDGEESAALYSNTLSNDLMSFFGLTTGDICTDRSVERAVDVLEKYQLPASLLIAGYTSVVQYGICITEEDKLPPSSNYATKFSFGFINEIFNTADIDAMTDGITSLTIQYLKLKIKCITDKRNITISLPCVNCADKNALEEDIKCLTGISPQDALELIETAEAYAKANYSNPYVHGKVTAFIVSAAIPVLGEVKFANLTKVLSKIKNTELLQKFTTLSNKIKNKSVRQIINELKGVNNVGKSGLLTKLGSHPNVTSLVNRLDDVADASLISKLDDIATNNPTKLAQLNDLYNPSTFSLPADRPFLNGISGAKVGGDFTITKVIDGQNISVYYNKAGYPNLSQFSAGSDYNYVSNALSGLGGDMTLANNTMKQKFLSLPDKFKWNGSTSWFEIKDVNGNWVKYTWHHYQDGRKMFPVPSKIHNATEGGFNHTGGKAVITKGLQDLFD